MRLEPNPGESQLWQSEAKLGAFSFASDHQAGASGQACGLPGWVSVLSNRVTIAAAQQLHPANRFQKLAARAPCGEPVKSQGLLSRAIPLSIVMPRRKRSLSGGKASDNCEFRAQLGARRLRQVPAESF